MTGQFNQHKHRFQILKERHARKRAEWTTARADSVPAKQKRKKRTCSYVPPSDDWNPLGGGCYHRIKHGGAE